MGEARANEHTKNEKCECENNNNKNEIKTRFLLNANDSVLVIFLIVAPRARSALSVSL